MLIDDLRAMSYEELDALVRAAVAERDRKRTLATAPARTEQAALDYLAASGLTPGHPWVHLGPVGYPTDWTVTHGGNLWRSTVANNTREPGTTDDWEQVEGAVNG